MIHSNWAVYVATTHMLKWETRTAFVATVMWTAIAQGAQAQATVASAAADQTTLTGAPIESRAPERSAALAGLMLGVEAGASGIRFEGRDMQSSAAMGVRVGIGVTSRIMAYGAASRSSLNIRLDQYTGAYRLSHYNLGARVALRPERSGIMPYVGAAFTVWTATRTGAITSPLDDPNPNAPPLAHVRVTGPAGSANGGVQWFVARHLAFDVNAEASIGRFQRLETDVANDSARKSYSTGLGVTAGVAWYVGRR